MVNAQRILRGGSFVDSRLGDFNHFVAVRDNYAKPPDAHGVLSFSPFWMTLTLDFLIVYNMPLCHC